MNQTNAVLLNSIRVEAVNLLGHYIEYMQRTRQRRACSSLMYTGGIRSIVDWSAVSVAPRAH